MLDNEERQRFDELAFAITKRPLSGGGNLRNMAA